MPESGVLDDVFYAFGAMQGNCEFKNLWPGRRLEAPGVGATPRLAWPLR